jgi:hypothetical protein
MTIEYIVDRGHMVVALGNLCFYPLGVTGYVPQQLATANPHCL